MPLRTVTATIGGFCLLGVLASLCQAGPFTKDEELNWQKDLHAAREVAQRDDKPMMLVFGAEWCTFCKKMEKSTLANPHMVKYINATFVPVHIDVDKDPRVAKILEVESLPCTIILSPQADLLGRIEGYENPSDLYKKLTAAKQLQSRVSQTSTAAPE